MKFSFANLSYNELEQRLTWLGEYVSPRKYYIHTAAGGEGWRYHISERTIEIDDERTATMFALKFG